MMLFVGLGNPGSGHAKNRHNIGFMAVDEIVRRHSFGPWRNRFQGEVSEGFFGTEKVLVLKPMTYMNESGRSVGEAVRFFKLDMEDVVVFHDELDLAPGRLRMKKGGGLAGHNGLRSLDAHLGPDFRRVRLGIGHPGNKNKVHAYVLKDFAKSEEDWLQPLIDAVAEAAPFLAKGDDAGFATKTALILQPPKEKPRKSEARPKNQENGNGI